MVLDARPDHVAVAVPDPAVAEGFWRERLGGARVSEFSNDRFQGRQLRFANGGKLELLGPAPDDPSPDNFVRLFLDRFGTRVHHVTLIVPDLLRAIDDLEAAGMEPVDVSVERESWKEAFLRPSQVGGIVVQVAQAAYSGDEWARRQGQRPEATGPDAASLLGPHLVHPDLDEATRLWRLLGGRIHAAEGRITVRWGDAPLEVVVSEGPAPGPVSLRVRGFQAWGPEPGVAPELEPA